MRYVVVGYIYESNENLPSSSRITFSCLPASWYCSVSLLSLGCVPRQRAFFLVFLTCSALVFLGVYQTELWGPQRHRGQVNK